MEKSCYMMAAEMKLTISKIQTQDVAFCGFNVVIEPPGY
jgi:hypothetical protein